MTATRRWLATAATALAAFTAFAAPAPASVDDRAPYIVVLTDDADGDADARLTRVASAVGAAPTQRYRSVISGFAAQLSRGQADKLREDPSVQAVVPDTVHYAAGLQSTAPGETVPPGARRIGASTTTAVHEPATHSVAVLDSGIDLGHPDLAATHGVNCIKPSATANDDNGHGTNVAGIIAARNNGSLLTGVAPGTRLYSVKVLNARNTGTLSQILCGIDWVTQNAVALDIRVVNMSLSGPGTDDGNCGRTNNDVYHQAICASTAAGVAYVAAAGNSKVDLARSAPAAYRETLAVTAMSDANGAPGGLAKFPSACKTKERDDEYASYSNYAVSPADAARVVAAPGTCVVSDGRGGGTSTYTGTSQAAPHVAGALALCMGSGQAAGPCEGLAPAAAITRVHNDAAAAATTANGFLGDPLRPVAGRAYGPLVTAAGY